MSRKLALTLNTGQKPTTTSMLQIVADSVEKHPFASAKIAVPNPARTPFLSGFARLLQCRKDLGQFAEVLGGCGE
jgi:tRNA U34 5-methylaminomethyl-2-thiouridine-forming methyltransferase MnmC